MNDKFDAVVAGAAAGSGIGDDGIVGAVANREELVYRELPAAGEILINGKRSRRRELQIVFLSGSQLIVRMAFDADHLVAIAP